MTHEFEMNSSAQLVNMSMKFINGPPLFRYHHLIKVCVLMALFFAALVGNIRTLVVLLRQRRKNSHSQRTLNTLILQLCVADLFVAFFYILGDGVWNMTIQWVGGIFLCKFVKFAQSTSLCLSTYVITIISFDRAYAILNPIQHPSNWVMRIRVCLAVSWFVSGLLSLPNVVMFSVRRGPWKEDFYQCLTRDNDRPFWEQTLYPIACVIFMFLLPLTTMLVSYALILHTIIKKSREFSIFNRESMKRTRPNDSSNNTSEEDDIQQSVDMTIRSSTRRFVNRPQNIRSMKVALFDRAKIQSFRMFAAIIITFVISWSPYWVLFLLTTFYKMDDEEVRKIVGEVSHWVFCFGMMNCALNPFIFGYFNTGRCNGRRNLANSNKPGQPMVIMQVTWRPAHPASESDPI